MSDHQHDDHGSHKHHGDGKHEHHGQPEQQPMLGMKKDGWFREESVLWPGQAMSYKVQEVLHHSQTKFQELTIFKGDAGWGNIMVLDGAVQLTDRDEFVYHEMMSHVPLLAHSNPAHVLIIGGGDGGVLREVLKHPSVKECQLVDIDGAVVEQAKIHFPKVAVGFSDNRAKVTVGDGAAYVRDKNEVYDVIIVDSSDPEGPASVLFGKEFYAAVHAALRPGGIVACQGENIWLHKKLITSMLQCLKEVGFVEAKYSLMGIPSYPCGSIGALLGRKGGPDTAPLSKPLRELAPDTAKALKYYSPAIHATSFVLPKFAEDLNA